MNPTYLDVTELAGEKITSEQLQRLCNRYYWASSYCKGKDVLEVACGSGPGLGYLLSLSKSLVAGDVSSDILKIARDHYGDSVNLQLFDACSMPFLDASFDVILIFEAIYYLPDPDKFVLECKRVLRPNGHLLIVTTNKDLYDFNPSPYSQKYFGVVELSKLLEKYGFHVDFLAGTSIKEVSLKQKLFRPIKKIASSLGLIPKTMHGKQWLKKIVFGELVSMPAEIDGTTMKYEPPKPITSDKPDTEHKIIYCAASLNN